MEYKPGDTVYIVESVGTIRETTVMKISGGMAALRFRNGGGIRVRVSRLFPTKEAAEEHVKKTRRSWKL